MEVPVYIRCRNCGRYVEESAAVMKYYCSPECSTRFTRCRNCGKFFIAGESGSDTFCSEECMVQYGEHEIIMQRG